MKAEMDSKEQPEARAIAAKKAPQRNHGGVFWGILFVLFGILLLLQNYSVLSVDFSAIWRLWPLFIVSVGLSMLSFRGWVSRTISALFAIIAIGLIAWAALGGLRPGTPTSSTTKNIEVSQTNNAITKSNLTIKGGAGNIDIRSDGSSSLVRATLDSNFSTLRQNSSDSNGASETTVSVEGKGNWWSGNFKNDLTVILNESIATSLKVDAGASNIDADLSNVDLRQLEIDSGASNLEYKLGSKSDTTDVKVQIGMSTLTLLVPKNSGLSVRLDSGLSSRTLPGLSKMSNGDFESDNYASAAKKITIHGNIGMANFDLKYY